MTAPTSQTHEQLKTQLEGVEQAVNALKSKSDAEVAKAKTLLGSIATLRKGVEGLTPGEKNANPSGDEINALKARIAVMEAGLGELLYATPPFHDNRKVFYQEAGQWARHFSTVRMTVMTFTITTCAAIVAWRWQGKGPDIQRLLVPTAALWATGVFVFWVFTYHTYRKAHGQKKFRDWMPDGIHGASTEAGEVKLDWASFVVPVLSGGLLCLAHQNEIVISPWYNAVAAGFCVLSASVPVWILYRVKESSGRGKIIILDIMLTVLVGAGGYFGLPVEAEMKTAPLSASDGQSPGKVAGAGQGQPAPAPPAAVNPGETNAAGGGRSTQPERPPAAP